MAIARKWIWRVAISSIILLNLATIGLLPMHKGVQRPIGGDLASVYASTGDQGEIAIPEQKWDSPNPNDPNGRYVDTGHKVRVYLRWSERNGDVVFTPRITLLILGAAFFLDSAAGFLQRSRAPRSVSILLA